jgi:hypothetical protein
MASTTSTLAELKEIVAYHRTELEKAESILRDREDGMKKRVIAMENRLAYKYDWKRAVERGLMKNVQNILDECADYLCHDEDDLGAEFVAAAKVRFGKEDTLERQEFCLLVIQYLRSRGSFHCEETKLFDDFEDTAGGCDEITQDAAMYLIKNPDWTPSA